MKERVIVGMIDVMASGKTGALALLAALLALVSVPLNTASQRLDALAGAGTNASVVVVVKSESCRLAGQIDQIEWISAASGVAALFVPIAEVSRATIECRCSGTNEPDVISKPEAIMVVCFPEPIDNGGQRQ